MALDGSVNGQRGPSTHGEMYRVDSTRRGIRESPIISAGGRCAVATDTWAKILVSLDDKPTGAARRSRGAREVGNHMIPCITLRHFKRPAVVNFELSCGCRDIFRRGGGSTRNHVIYVCSVAGTWYSIGRA